LCINFDNIKYILRVHIVLYDFEILSSSVRQKHEVMTIGGFVLGIIFERDKEEIMHRTSLNKEFHNL
jgi:hypothetical protein